MLDFPLYRNDGIPSVRLNELQRKSIAEFTAKLENGTYHFVDNSCLCGGHDDICITEKDRYGIPCRYVLCRKCGVVRLEKRLDDESTALFYRDDYRNIYNANERVGHYFRFQERRGDFFWSVIEKYADTSRIHTAFEAGCGAGGVLYAFHKRGIKSSGCDFGEEYLTYGREKGLNLYVGEPDTTKTPQDSQDIAILSHVIEHLNNPAEYVNQIIDVISPGGYMIIQVPGLLTLHRQNIRWLVYFQNAHVNNFYEYFLRKFFEALGLEVIYGDEWCTFLLRKPENWLKRDTSDLKIYDDTMPERSRKIQRALKRYYVFSLFRGYYFLHPLKALKRMLVLPLEILGVKEKIKKLIGRA